MLQSKMGRQMQLALLVFAFLFLGRRAHGFDFFYLVLEWPGSYCDGAKSCCYPNSGKPPADFTIHGLWPDYDDGSYPSNCNPSNPFDASQIADIRRDMDKLWSSLSCPSSNSVNFWKHEWDKHGTCVESLDQHGYFSAALQLRKGIDLLGALESAGIRPDDNSHGLGEVKSALESAVGFMPGVTCNRDPSGTAQLFEVYVCVDKDASTLIRCPVLPSESCPSRVEFPSF